MSLQFVGVTKKYGRGTPALDRFSLTIESGQVVGLVGLNGAGKSTAIRIGAHVTLPSSGCVVVDGEPPSVGLRFSTVGWVPEAPIHPRWEGLARLLAYYSAIGGGVDAKGRLDLLHSWGLGAHAGRPFNALSLGLKKRFALVVAQLNDPPYYLLDEVFNGLDPAGIADTRAWILAQKSAGRGVLVSSHQLGEIESVADAVAIVHEGRLLRMVDPATLASQGRRRIRVDLRVHDSGALRIAERFGVVERTTAGVLIETRDAEVSDVGRAFSSAGYQVRRISVEDSDLETYFLSLVGRGT